MLQDFLTALIEIIVVGFAIVIAIDFAQGQVQRIQRRQQPTAHTSFKRNSVVG